jgi:uncharacterized protein (DUF302 family)
LSLYSVKLFEIYREAVMGKIMYLLTGFIFGTALTLFLAFRLFPSMMFEVKESRFGYSETIDLIERSSEDNGWAVAKIWDLGDRMVRAGFEDAPNVKVLELCHAENSYNVLKNEEDMFISVLMPCRMAVYEQNDGKVFVSRMNIGLMSKFFSSNVKKVMSGVAKDDENILRDIIDSK